MPSCGSGHEKLPAVTDVGPPAPPATTRGQDRLHQPLRLVVAVVELLLAAVAGWAATRCWDLAVAPLTVRSDDGATLVSRVYEGNWVGLAFLLAAVAGVLLVDAARQSVLGVRTRRRRRRRASRGTRAADAR